MLVNGLAFLFVGPAFPLTSKELKGPPCLLLMTCATCLRTLWRSSSARKVSPVEVVEALAERIKRLNPKLNAYITLDLENARKDAEMKHRIRKEHPDGDLGLLHGVPVAIRDDLEVAGVRCACRSRPRQKEIGKPDDLTVARLRKPDAIALGKANEPEFGGRIGDE
jgi:Asp-tRNA(Asn)/Glu-tRNA(Gln) amidotransferase A subunit family amidase